MEELVRERILDFHHNLQEWVKAKKAGMLDRKQITKRLNMVPDDIIPFFIYGQVIKDMIKNGDVSDDTAIVALSDDQVLQHFDKMALGESVLTH